MIPTPRTVTVARRFISFKAAPPPPSRRQRLRTRFIVATIGSASVVSLYAALGPAISAESPSRDYSSSVRLTDTASHPRNYKMTVTDAVSASTLLRTNEKSSYPESDPAKSTGIISYHFNQVASNSPIEDDHVESTVERNGESWSFFGLFDGHSGWTTSDRLKRDLVPYVTRSLTSVTAGDKSPQTIQKAIQKGFVDLDRDIVYHSADDILKSSDMTKAAAIAQLMPALSGSCGLLACFDAVSKNLHVAVTGDSRAIYARRNGNTWILKALSEDQTGSTASEVARLRSEHPGEENVVKNGRILGGLEPSRAFGDSRYKWSSSTQSKISQRFYGRRAPPTLLSPPYVTARPEVTTTKIDTSEDGFMVLGTDGLYEMLTNEEITELVVNWRAKYDRHSASSGVSSWIPAFLGGQAGPKIVNEDVQGSGQKMPHEKSQKKFVYEDANVSTHIIRNALGGGDTNRLYGLLSLPYPLSRSYRDDISVTVVFFGDNGHKSGDGREAKI